jgi:hypothetical protein
MIKPNDKINKKDLDLLAHKIIQSHKFKNCKIFMSSPKHTPKVIDFPELTIRRL